MAKALYTCTAALVLALVVATAPATAQFPPTSEDAPAGAAKGKKGAAAAAPTINGNWAGELSQVGSQSPYKFEISIGPRGVETKYPDLDCIGKLNRVGTWKAYTYFAEVITKGQADKGGRCPDGTLTLARHGDDLSVGWFGVVQDTTVVAYGTLKKK